MADLTKEQEARIPEFKAKWRAVSLDTTPGDRAKAEEGARIAYEAAGYKFPKVRWFESAVAACRYVAKEINKDGDVPRAASMCIGGQHEAGWLAFFDFYKEVAGIDYKTAIAGHMLNALHCGWWWAFDEECIMSDKCTEVHLDAEDRPHNPKGPALGYKDGLGIYAWHGLSVYKSWIMTPDSVDCMKVLNERNAERRRAGVEILGWERILKALKVKVLDTDPDPQIGELLETDLPDQPRQKFIRVKCGTGRQFCLPVPPEVKTALEGNAWTFGFEDVKDIEKFREYEVRT